MDISITPEILVSLATLTLMEVVLGIDNLVFISILTGKLPPERQPLARRLGLGLALFSRLALLFSLSWVMRLSTPLFTVLGQSLSGRDLILLGGGVFLIGKATTEIYEKVEIGEHERAARGASSFAAILAQIVVLDLVFSLDSVITAVGMAQELWVMVVAMVLAVGAMVVFANSIGDFVMRHPSVKILALAFLVLIGVMLTAEGLGQHVSKGYIYAAMGFSIFVELLNMRFRKKSSPPVGGAVAASA